MNDDPSQFNTAALYYVGFCRVCGTGPLGLRICGDCGQVVVVCDECDAAWPSADVDVPPATTGHTTLPCPHCNSDLFEPPAHWANTDEVDACSWLADAVANNRLAIQVGTKSKDDQQSPPS